jgi:GT2 family glycosyltransferase
LQTSGISDFEIIVSDDASTDTSVEFLEQNYPKIIIIKNKINKGFAGNVNSGVNIAEKDLVFILNSDVKLSEGYFKFLLPYFDDSETFGVMGRIMSMNGEKIQDGAKYPCISFSNIVSTKNYISKDHHSLYTLFMSGANSLVDRGKLLEIGGYNELFNPYYCEDVDLGLTAWKLGYKLYYEHNAVCYHPNSATIKKQHTSKVKRVSRRNKLILHYLHLDGIRLWYFMLLYILKMSFRLIALNTLYLKSFSDFLSMYKKVEFKKKENKKNEKKDIDYIKKYIIEDINNRKIDVVTF